MKRRNFFQLGLSAGLIVLLPKFLRGVQTISIEATGGTFTMQQGDWKSRPYRFNENPYIDPEYRRRMRITNTFSCECALPGVDASGDEFSEEALTSLEQGSVGLFVTKNFDPTLPPIGRVLNATRNHRGAVELEVEMFTGAKEGSVVPGVLIEAADIDALKRSRLYTKITPMNFALTDQPCDTRLTKLTPLV